MRALQNAHEAAANTARLQVVGAGVLPTRHPAKLNGDGRRPDANDTLQLKLDQPDGAATVPQPTARRRPVRGRRATDRRPTAFPHPSQLTPQAPFMAQLMSQDRPPAEPGAKPAPLFTEVALVSAQRRQIEQVNAYRKTITMATDFIIRRYHLAADFQGLMISDTRTVEMVV